jgi:hypothetical protein
MSVPSIEQAVFATSRTGAAAQRTSATIATSRGVVACDLAELEAWRPRREMLPTVHPTGDHLQFHPLPSGCCALSRTVSLDEDESADEMDSRTLPRLYTHSLVLPPHVMEEFRNHPIHVYLAACAQGVFRRSGQGPGRLEPVSLFLDPCYELNTLRRAAFREQGERIAALLQAVLDSISLGMIGNPTESLSIFESLYSCLPVSCRSEVSFSTGLNFSDCRPVRVADFSNAPHDVAQESLHGNVLVFDIDQYLPFEDELLEAWPLAVLRMLRASRIETLMRVCESSRLGQTLNGLSVMGREASEYLDRLAEWNPGPEESDKSRVSVGEQRIESMVAMRPDLSEDLITLDRLLIDVLADGPNAPERFEIFWDSLRIQLDFETQSAISELYIEFALSNLNGKWRTANGGSLKNVPCVLDIVRRLIPSAN